MFRRLKKFLMSKKGILAILLIIAIAVFLFTRKGGNGSGVKTTTVERGTVTSELILSGDVVAKDYAKLTFPASGQMASVNVTEGDMVTKGQILGKMDTAVLNSVYQQAVSNHRAAQTAVDTIHDQLKGKDTSETFSEKESRTALEVSRDNAYEAMLIARKNLSQATFRSPINGVISQVGVNTPGGSVTVGGLAFEVVSPGTIYFSSTADQNEVGMINKGDKVTVTLDAYEGKTFDSRVETVGLTPKAGEAETVYHIKVSLPGTNGIRVGMTGDASLILEKKENVLYVDPLFVKTDSEGKYVLKGPQKEKVRVATGLEGEENIEIVSGLSEGDVLYQK